MNKTKWALIFFLVSLCILFASGSMLNEEDAKNAKISVHCKVMEKYFSDGKHFILLQRESDQKRFLTTTSKEIFSISSIGKLDIFQVHPSEIDGVKNPYWLEFLRISFAASFSGTLAFGIVILINFFNKECI